MAAVTGMLKLDTGKRWWFDIARIATILLIMVGIVKNTERAAEWLARNGLWFRAYIEDGEGHRQSL